MEKKEKNVIPAEKGAKTGILHFPVGILYLWAGLFKARLS